MIDFSSKGKLIIRMEDHVKKILEEAKEDMAGTENTPHQTIYLRSMAQNTQFQGAWIGSRRKEMRRR